MARKTSALDEAITLIEILQRIPKHRKVTLLEIQEGLADDPHIVTHFTI